jgi:hypothetical protein
VLHNVIALTAAFVVITGTTAAVARDGIGHYHAYDTRRPPRDEAELRGSTLYVQPGYAEVMLPPAWFGEKDSVALTPSCGHHIRGALARRLAMTQPMLDSARNATGEWDREYSAVVDSILPFEHLLAQLGPEPFGAGNCFADLQMRVYVTSLDPSVIASIASGAGVATARRFFSASIASRDSASWHIDHLQWDARYFDYGAEANVELYSTRTNGRTLTLVFMRASWSRGDPAEADQIYVLQHVRIGR